MLKLIGWALVAAPAVAQTTWHVDVHAPAGGDGSASAPFNAIQQAHDQPATVAGDTILVAPGVYDEHLTITKYLTVRSSGGALVTLIAPTTAGTVVQMPSNSVWLGGGPWLEGFSIIHPPVAGGNTITARSGALDRCAVYAEGANNAVLVQYDLVVAHSLVTGAVVGVREHAQSGGFAMVFNSIVVGNTTDLITPVTFSALVQYSCYETANFDGDNTNVVASPQLFDLSGRDPHLRASSPCIDAGDPQAPLDPDGTRADIGPFPFDSAWTPSQVYCTAQVNSLGCTPSISALGTASATSSQACTLSCVDELNQKTGLFFYGFGPRNTPYQGGYLCVASPLRRTAPMNSGGSVGLNDCSGSYSLDLNALIQSGSDPLLAPGADVHVQCWSRDPGASFTTNRSNAVRVRVLP